MMDTPFTYPQILQPMGYLTCRACTRCGEQGGISESWLPPRPSSWARNGEAGSPQRHRGGSGSLWFSGSQVLSALQSFTSDTGMIQLGKALHFLPTPESPRLQLEMQWKSRWAWGEADTNAPSLPVSPLDPHVTSLLHLGWCFTASVSHRRWR